MSFLHLVVCSLTICSFSEGRIVLGMLGHNMSLSWTFNIIKNDAMYILHNESPIHRFFPNSNSVSRNPPQRGSFTVEYTMPGHLTVTIHFLDLTENDAGTYRVVRQWNLEDLVDRVDLQTIGITYYTRMATTHKETTEGINYYTSMATTHKETTEEIPYYTTKAVSRKEVTEGVADYTTADLSQKVITDGINHYKTTAMTSEVDAEAFPSKNHMLYIVLGMGGILAVAFIACLQHKIRICLRTDGASSDIGITDSIKNDGADKMQEDNLSGNYWTIVSNQRGELSTAIEMDLKQHSEPQLIAQTMVHIDNKSEEILKPSNITRKEELDGYLNPVQSIPMEFKYYIHPVHSDPVNAISDSIQYIEIL